MANPIDGPVPVLRPGPRCEARGHGVGPDNGVWNCGAQPGHGGRVHVVFRSATRVPEIWFSWPTTEAMEAEGDWADQLTRKERMALREMLARNCQFFWEAARPRPLRAHTGSMTEYGNLENALMQASREMADLHLDVTERAAVPVS